MVLVKDLSEKDTRKVNNPLLCCISSPQAVEQRIREEQRMMDEKIVLELDQKVIDQQSTLEKAGVSGFYITTNPQVGLCLSSKRKIWQCSCANNIFFFLIF